MKKLMTKTKAIILATIALIVALIQLIRKKK